MRLYFCCLVGDYARGVTSSYGVGVAGRGLSLCCVHTCEGGVRGVAPVLSSVPVSFRPFPDTELLPCVLSECLPFFCAYLVLWGVFSRSIPPGL